MNSRSNIILYLILVLRFTALYFLFSLTMKIFKLIKINLNTLSFNFDMKLFFYCRKIIKEYMTNIISNIFYLGSIILKLNCGNNFFVMNI